MKVVYTDGTSDESDAVDVTVLPSTLVATFMGVPGQDYVGQTQWGANGNPDWSIHLQGLRSTPIKVRVTSASGGIWEDPFNGSNWVILTQIDRAGNCDLWFEPWSTSGLHVKVWYADGSTDEKDCVDGNPILSTLRASFLGVTGEDFVGSDNQTTANGIPDWHIRLQGLRSLPVKIQIASTPGGVWETPYNNANWIIGVQFGSSADADFWFEPWNTGGFHITMWFADGTADEVDVQ